MKAILEFSLPEESEEHSNAVNGGAWKAIVWDMDQWLRGKMKYEDKELLKTEEVRAKLGEIIYDYNLNLYE